MFIYLLRILIEKLRDHKSDILRAPGYSVYQFTTDMWQAEVQEVIMGIMQIADQVLDRQAFADILDRRIPVSYTHLIGRIITSSRRGSLSFRAEIRQKDPGNRGRRHLYG